MINNKMFNNVARLQNRHYPFKLVLCNWNTHTRIHKRNRSTLNLQTCFTRGTTYWKPHIEILKVWWWYNLKFLKSFVLFSVLLNKRNNTYVCNTFTFSLSHIFEQLIILCIHIVSVFETNVFDDINSNFSDYGSV